MNIKETLLIALAGLIFLTLTGVAKAEVVTDSNGNVLYERETVDGHLKHVYKTVEIQNRVANRTCSEVDVPIYSRLVLTEQVKHKQVKYLVVQLLVVY